MAVNITAFPPNSVTNINVGKGVLITFVASDLDANNILQIENTIGSSPLHISIEDNVGNQIVIPVTYITIALIEYLNFDFTSFVPVSGTWSIRISL